jgi:hypothetical protein
MFLCVSVIFSVVSFTMLRDGRTLEGGLGLGVFGLASIFFTIRLLPNSTYLRLTPVGFEMCILFKKSFFRWEEVTNFAVVEVNADSSREMVGFDYTPQFRGGGTNDKIRKINMSISGREASLPDSFGLKNEELVALLVKWHGIATNRNYHT